jgi:prepilin-type N-terminal cleavage/methylation domain-containing protein
MSANARPNLRGYTLVELLVVLAIIAVLLGLLLAAVQQVREYAQLTTCENNQKQLALAFAIANDANGVMPPGVGVYPPGSTNNLGTGFFHILPYLENRNLYFATASPGGTYYDARNNGVQGTPITIFQCPADFTAGSGVREEYDSNQYGTMSYPGNAQVFCQVYTDQESRTPPFPNAFYMKDPQGTPSLTRTFTDGTSSTILFAEKAANCTYPGYYPVGGSLWAYRETAQPAPLHPAFAVSWSPQSVGPVSVFQVRPNPALCDPSRTSTFHRVMPVAMADGSVHTLSPNISHDLWWALCTPNNGDVATGNW